MKKENLGLGMVLVLVLVIEIFGYSTISNKLDEKYEKYDNAMKITSQEDLQEAIKGKNNNVIIEGDFSSDALVAVEELSEEYISIKKISQKYNKHFRRAGKVTRHYKRWDRYKMEKSLSSEYVTIFGIKLNTNKLDISDYYERLSLTDDTVVDDMHSKLEEDYLYQNSPKEKSLGDIRYYYQVIPKEFHGTIFVNISNNEYSPINSDIIKVHKGTTDDLFDEVQESKILLKITFVTIFSLTIVGIFFIFWKGFQN